MPSANHIKFGDGLAVTDEGSGVIRVDGTGGPAGATGPAGPAGATGSTGPAGPGVPTGGTAGQVLAKSSGTDYATAWATPVGAADLSLKVDRDAVELATARLVAVKLAAGDTQPAFRIAGDGRHDWGPGGSGAVDTALRRLAAATLNTPNALSTGAAQGVFGYNAGGAGTYQGPGGTFGSVRAANGFAFSAALLGDTGTVRLAIDSTGKLQWADGTIAAPDANLYRRAPGYLGSDSGLWLGKDLVANLGDTAAQLWLHPDGHIYFGQAADTNLYRSAAGWLTTDGSLVVTGKPGYNPGLRITGNSYEHAFQIFKASADGQPVMVIEAADAKIDWGPGGAAAMDTNLRRAGVNTLQTDGLFVALSSVYSHASSAGGAGFVADGLAANGYTLLGKQAADSQFRFVVDANGKITWGPGGTTAQDTMLYRAAGGILKTDGAIAQGGGIYGISLPASPVDGQEYILVDSLTNPSYQWRFRYNGGHTGDAYRWEFVGGSPMRADDPASATIGSSWVVLGTPALTTPRTGIYDVECGVAAISAPSTTTVQMGISPNNSTTPYTQVSISVQPLGSPAYFALPPSGGRVALSAGDLLKIVGHGGAAGATWQYRYIKLLPVRVS